MIFIKNVKPPAAASATTTLLRLIPNRINYSDQRSLLPLSQNNRLLKKMYFLIITPSLEPNTLSVSDGQCVRDNSSVFIASCCYAITDNSCEFIYPFSE